jgi:hypothetical protein
VPENVRVAEELGVDPAKVRDAGTVDPEDIAKATGEQPPSNINDWQPPAEGQPEIPFKPMTDEQKFEGLKFTAFPGPIRDDVKAVLKENQGFEVQRRGVQTWEGHTQPQADAIQVDLQNALKRGTALNAEELKAVGDTLLTLSVRARKLAEQLAQNPADLRVAAELGEVRAQHRVVEMSLAGATSEAGRALNIVRATAKLRSQTDADFFEELMKLPQFADDQRKFAETMAAIGDDPVKQYQFLQQEARKAQSWSDWWKSYSYANMLSGLPTHERNIQSNTLNLTFGVAADAVRDAARGDMGPSLAYLKGMKQALLARPDDVSKTLALPRAFERTFFVMRDGFNPDRFTGKLDDVMPEFSGGGANPFNWPRRALEAMDAFQKETVRSGETYRAAYELAKQDGIEGLEERMVRYLDGTVPLPKKVQKSIDEIVLRSAYQEEVGGFAKGLMSAFRHADEKFEQFHVPFRTFMVAPFIRIAANLMRQGVEHTPLGFMTKAGLDPGRLGQHARARAAVGSLTLMPIAYYAGQGYITGAGPQDPGERAEWMASGKRPHSIYIPSRDEWVNYQTWQPIGLPMAAIANAVESYNSAWKRSVEEYGEGSEQAKMSEMEIAEAFATTMWQTVLRTSGSILGMSMLSGVDSAMKAIERPESAGEKWWAGLVGQQIPLSGMMRSVAQQVEQTRFGEASVRAPQGFKEIVATHTPGLSQIAQPLIDRAGQEAKVYGSPLMRGFWAASPAVHSQLNAELARLEIQPVRPDRELTDEMGKKYRLTPGEETQLMKARGQARFAGYALAMSAPGYADMPRDAQIDLMETFARDNVTLITELARISKRLNEPLTHEKLLASLRSPSGQ